ncbi:hypothetical protein [Microcoleus sp. FACHB-1515]|uniref:hypothetical protein n=1 Tax=Cyanophyceae TaxID=3028117 RepID=UPI00168A0555|nr:hypothetical protein [Microcoleus sp. FACHB-1515]
MPQPPPNSGNAKPPAPRNNALENLWQKTQPVLNKTAARSLRSIIWLLEQALVKVEPNAPEAPRIAAEPAPPLFRQIGRVWAWLLKTIRSILPRSQREKLSDTALSGIIIGTVLLALWINSALKPTAPEPIIASRPAIEQPAPDVPIPDTLPAPAEPTPAIEGGEAIAPEPSESLAIEPEPIEIAPEPIEPSVAEVPEIEPQPEIREPEMIELEPEPEAIEVPPEPEAEEPPPEVSTEKASEGGEATEPPPPPQLTPEQTLVAAIQDQVGNLTNQYGNGLIENIQANFRSGRLTVKINDSWYELSEARQNQLASDMLDRARSLDFRRLEITDSQGTLVARSPIVGTDMIILQRSTEN